MKNLAAEMYIIFRVREDAYSSDPPSTPQSRVYIKRSTAHPNIGEDKGTAANPKKRRRDKKRDDDSSLSGSAVNKKNKRKCASEY